MDAAETGCTVVVMGVQGTGSRAPTGRFTCERAVSEQILGLPGCVCLGA